MAFYQVKDLAEMKQIVTSGLHNHATASHLDDLIGVIIQTKESYRKRGMWTVLLLPKCGAKAKRVTLCEKYLQPRSSSPPECPSVILHPDSKYGTAGNSEEATFGRLGQLKLGFGVTVTDKNNKYYGEVGILTEMSRVTNTYKVQFFCDNDGSPANFGPDGTIKNPDGTYRNAGEGEPREVAFGWKDITRSGTWVKEMWNNPSKGDKIRVGDCKLLSGYSQAIRTQPDAKPGAIGTYMGRKKVPGTWNTYTHNVKFEEEGLIEDLFSEQIETVEN